MEEGWGSSYYKQYLNKLEDHKKLYRLLRLIALLKQSPAYPVERLAQRFEISTRTIYRYFELLQECGFEIAKTPQNRYYIVTHSNDPDQTFTGFSMEEAGALREALLAVHPNHPLKESLLSKLHALSDLDQLADLIYDRMLAQNISKLNIGIREQRQVRLRQYHSLNTGHITDRLVEPVGFTANMKYLVAYDMNRQAVRQFKPERIGEVEVLETPFVYAHDHESILPDRFGMNGTPACRAVLRLSDRARQLLREEYPVEEEVILEQLGEEWCRMEVLVKGFEGIGRFILGLPGEVVVEEPVALQEYLREKMEQFDKYV